ncbi:MAG: biotin--[acetyl-CoA-carboxylase] ligase [Bacteroidales bacterium]|nr:biotin--[acetyl-CoA-carboxylase] ligase [Candidatus Cacconaster merdequi]
MAESNIKWFDTVDSTNSTIARDKENLADMSVYAAFNQSSGRGQRGNKWESKAGENLTFSILFKPRDLNLREQFCISQTVSMGVVDYLSGKGVTAKVKWPNDIYVSDRKICGILIENTAFRDKLSASIAGIGFNLNQMKFESDAPNPVSLSMITGKSYDIRLEMEVLLQHILSIYLSITEGDRAGYLRTSLDGRFLEAMYRRGEWHWFEEMPQCRRIQARILGTDDSARLVTEHRDGSIHSYAFKEIKYLL